jgi:putative transposase
MRLPNYERLQQECRLDQAMMDQIAFGLTTRNYEHSIQALCDGYGIKESSVSRHFIAASRRELEELLNRKLSDLQIGAVFLLIYVGCSASAARLSS